MRAALASLLILGACTEADGLPSEILSCQYTAERLVKEHATLALRIRGDCVGWANVEVTTYNKLGAANWYALFANNPCPLTEEIDVSSFPDEQGITVFVRLLSLTGEAVVCSLSPNPN